MKELMPELEKKGKLRECGEASGDALPVKLAVALTNHVSLQHAGSYPHP